MSEPTLSLQLSDIQARLGVFAGWGRGANFGETAWTVQQQAILDDCTQSGLRRFYYPEPLEGTATSYNWSFLHPVATIDLPPGAQSVNLPDDFGGFEDKVTVLTSSATSQPWKIDWMNEGRIREMYSQTPQMIGPPMYASLSVIKGTTGTSGTRYNLLMFPAADQDYKLQVAMYVNPDYLTTALPYALGGPEHVETILESCLACLEERIDDSRTVHADAFQRRLAASIGMDRKKKPQKLGYNHDRSDDKHTGYRNPHYWAPAATYNGGSFN